MLESELRTQSMDFAVSIIFLVKELKNQKESIISNQIGRSGTSIGANIREARYAHGEADFRFYVVNIGGYIGQSTKSEIEYARSLNKEVIFLEPTGSC